MPGRKSYGKSGKWIHDRAHHILGKNPEMPKGMAYAISTQQAHKVGKSPKKFRTKEGVRVAREKHALPKNFYKKTASVKKKIAMDRLLRLRKQANNPADAIAAAASADPEASAAARRFIWGRRVNRVLGLPVHDAVYDKMGGNKPIPMAMDVDPIQAARVKPPAGAVEKALKNPVLRKALKIGGLGALGVGAGMAAHGAAQSVGLSETGPADTLADMIVPKAKYSYDRKESARERDMYIPRYFLEKAAASMAGAVDTNNDMFEGEPGMHGPEASVIPQQTLETVVPIMQHVDKADEEAEGFLYRMFEKYKDTKDESIGRYTKGETEVPMSKQAGRLLVG